MSLSECQHSSIVPFLLRHPDYGGQAGTDRSLKTLTQHFVLGYFRWVPAGLIFSNSPMTCAILIATLKLTRMGSRRTATASLGVTGVVPRYHLIR